MLDAIKTRLISWLLSNTVARWVVGGCLRLQQKWAFTGRKLGMFAVYLLHMMGISS